MNRGGLLRGDGSLSILRAPVLELRKARLSRFFDFATSACRSPHHLALILFLIPRSTPVTDKMPPKRKAATEEKGPKPKKAKSTLVAKPKRVAKPSPSQNQSSTPSF